jgi:hypothetical protein
VFTELKNQIGLRRLRLRSMKFVREQFFLAGGPEHRATGAVPQSTDNTRSACHHLAEGREEKVGKGISIAQKSFL